MELVGELMKLTVLGAIAIAFILAVLIWKRNRSSKVTYLRFVVQALSVVVFFYLFTYPIWLLLVVGIIILMTFVFGRVFCGWLCPFGFYMDLVAVIRKALRVRYRSLPDKLNRALHYSRYFILIFFLVLPFVLTNIGPERFEQAWFFAGPFKPMKVLLEPLIPPVVPWAGLVVVNDVNFSYPYVQEIVEYVGADYGTILAYVFVGLTLAGTFIYRRFWCRFCPTGSSLGIVNRLKGFKWVPVVHLDKDEEKCTKCGICKRVCPVQVTEVYEEKGGKVGTSMCLLCLRCVEMCPYKECLKVKIGGKTVFKSRNWLEPSKSD